jgi:phenylacetate-CoA ligase
VIDALYAQLRFAASVLFGFSFSVRSLDRLIDALLDTRREFGHIGSEATNFVGGPKLDEETRRELQRRRFRTQAIRGADQTEYYGRLFDSLAIKPKQLSYEDIGRIPVTTKEALQADPDAFVQRDARPALRTMTTGTTGRPTSMYFSEREMRIFIALSAIGLLLQESIGPEDIVQVSTSSRAILGNTCFIEACARIGAVVYQAGLVEPAHALALLSEERRLAGKKPRTSVLMTYPSYLGDLVEVGLQAGFQPDDFGVERIVLGGEIVTAGLKIRCQKLFGPVQFSEGYGMTETWPFGGTLCPDGHLHFDVANGLLEVLNPDTTTPAQPGEVGTLVLTPFPPYRETTILLRYDTQDAVRAIAEPPTCALRHQPATSTLLGKLHSSVRHDSGLTFPRDVLEAIEAVDLVPLPARCSFWAVPGGVAIEVATPNITGSVRQKLGNSLEAWGVPVRELHLVENRSQLRQPLPLRGDLREGSFGLPRNEASLPQHRLDGDRAIPKRA